MGLLACWLGMLGRRPAQLCLAALLALQLTLWLLPQQAWAVALASVVALISLVGSLRSKRAAERV